MVLEAIKCRFESDLSYTEYLCGQIGKVAWLRPKSFVGSNPIGGTKIVSVGENADYTFNMREGAI